jgi:cytochrome c553
MQHQQVLRSISHHARRLFAGTLAAGLLAAAGSAVAAGDPAAKPASSCVACHTNVEKLKAEAATIPVPAASALQAGKG